MAGSFGSEQTAKVGSNFGRKMVEHGGVRKWSTHLRMYGSGSMAMNSRPEYGFPAGRRKKKYRGGGSNTRKKYRGKGVPSRPTTPISKVKATIDRGKRPGLSWKNGAPQMRGPKSPLKISYLRRKAHMRGLRGIDRSVGKYSKMAMGAGAMMGMYGIYKLAKTEGEEGTGSLLFGGAIAAAGVMGKKPLASAMKGNYLRKIGRLAKKVIK